MGGGSDLLQRLVLLHRSLEWPNDDVRNMSHRGNAVEGERPPVRAPSIAPRWSATLPSIGGAPAFARGRVLRTTKAFDVSCCTWKSRRQRCVRQPLADCRRAASNMSKAAWRIRAQASGPISAKNAFSVACRSALLRPQGSGRSADPSRASAGSAPFLGGDDRTLVDRGFDLEVVHQTLHAGQAEAEVARGREAILHRLADIRDARPPLSEAITTRAESDWLRWTLSCNSPYPA